MRRRVACILALASLAFLPIGCAAPGLQASSNASKSLASMGDSLATLQAQLSKCAASLEPIATAEQRNAANDLGKLFATFREDSKKLDDAFGSVEKSAASTDKDIKGFLADRQKTNDTMSDASIKKIDADQIAKIKAEFDSASASFATLREQIAPLKQSIDDLEKYLQGNLNVGGVKAGASIMQSVADKIRTLAPMVTSASTEYAELAASLVPPKDAKPTTSSAASSGQSLP